MVKDSTLFKDTATGRMIDVGGAPLFATLFGPFYFARHKVWKHALGGVLLVLLTGGMSWLVYPLYTERIMRGVLTSRNWISMPSPEVDRSLQRLVLFLLALVWVFAFCVVATLLIKPDF